MPCGPLRKWAGSPDRAASELLLTEVEADILRVKGRARMLDVGNKAFPASATPPRPFRALLIGRVNQQNRPAYPRDPRLRLNTRRVCAENIWLRPATWLDTSLPDCT